MTRRSVSCVNIRNLLTNCIFKAVNVRQGLSKNLSFQIPPFVAHFCPTNSRAGNAAALIDVDSSPRLFSHAGYFRWPDGVSMGTGFNLYGSSLTPLKHPLTNYFSWRCSPTLPIITKSPTKLSLYGYDRLAEHELFHTKYALLHGPTFHCSMNPRPRGTQPQLSATPPTIHTSSIATSKWVTLHAALCIIF